MNNKVSIADIRESLYDANLDTEYREALANAMMRLGYVSDSPLNLYFGTEKQKQEIERVDYMSLNANQISEIIHLMMYEMRNDFQYGSFKPVANQYINISREMRKSNLQNDKNEMEHKKPKCNIHNAFGDMFEIISLTSKELKQNNMYDESSQMIERVALSHDYDEAYNIINEYIETVDELENEEEFE